MDRNGTFTRNDDRVVAHLRVATEASPSGAVCHYDIVTGLPEGFVAASAGSDESRVDSYELSEPVVLTHDVKVAARDVYVTQNVSGDPAGGTARYSLTEGRSCGHAVSPAVSTVGLHVGSFNVSRAVLGSAGVEDADGRFGASRFVLNYQAEPCVVTVEISHLPAGCTTATESQSRDLTADVDAANRVVFDFDITCPNTATDMSQDNTGDMGEDMLIGPPTDTPTG